MMNIILISTNVTLRHTMTSTDEAIVKVILITLVEIKIQANLKFVARKKLRLTKNTMLVTMHRFP